MSAISLKSITGITSITTPAGVDNQLTLHNNNTTEAVKLDIAGNVHVNNHLSVAGVTTTQAFNATTGSFTKTSNNFVLVGSSNAGGAAIVLDGDSNGDGTGADYAYIEHNTSGDLNIVVDNPANAGNIKFFTNTSTERLRIKTTGDLSLRSNTQNAFLGLTADSTAINLTLGSTSGTQPRAYFYGSGNGQSYAGDLFLGAGTGGEVRLKAGQTIKLQTNADNSTIDAFFIGSNGRVGINTDNPQTTLYSMDEIAAGDGNRRFIGMETKVVNGTAVGEIRTTFYSGANGNYPEMRFVTHDTERLRINSNGTVHTLMTGTAPSWLGSTIATREKFSIFQGANFGEACFNIDVDNANTFLSHNMYYNGGWKIRKSGSPVRHLEIGTNGWTFMTGADGSDDTGSALTKRVRIDSGGKVSIGDAATHTFSAHSEGDDLVIGGAGWRGMTIYGEGGGGVIQFADNGDNRVGQILYYHAENSMSFRVNGNVTRLKIDSNGDVCIGNSGNPPWTETGGNYNNISLCGNDANSSGFLNLGNGAATNNADFDLARIKFHNGGTEVATIKATTATSDNGDADIKFFTKKAGSGAKEILRIRNDGFVETMYDQNTGSYSLSASPTPRLRIRNDYGGDGIISSAQFFAKRGSGAASIFDIGVITTSTDYESNLIISSRNTDASYSEKIRIESEGQLRMLYGNNAKQAYVLRSTFRTITGHSSTGFQYVRCALLGARTAYRVCINTTGGNYGPGAQFFTILRNWDSTTIYVSDKFNMGSAYANAVRMQSDNGGSNWYMEISINLTTTSQGFGLSVIPIGNNAGSMTTNLQYYGSGLSNLANTSSAHSL